MARRSLAYRKLRRRGVPRFMGHARILAHPRVGRQADLRGDFFAEEMAGGAPPVVLTQQGPNWCWAAVLQGLLALDGKPQTQQAIANRHTGRQCPVADTSSVSEADCTKDTGCDLPCDGPHNLRLAMRGWQYQPDYIRGDDPDLLAKLTSSLASAPVAARVGFLSAGGGHSILITRMTGSPGNPTIEYLSPIPYQGTPYPVHPATISWASLNDHFWLAGHEARLSHIYPRLQQ